MADSDRTPRRRQSHSLTSLSALRGVARGNHSLRFHESMPDVLYKYLRAEHVEQTMQGILRLGTLHDFRRQESHGDEIGDVGEGTKQVTQVVDGFTSDILRRPNILRQFFEPPPGANNIQFRGLSLEVRHNNPDIFVFCAAARFDQAAMREFKYDACLEIVRPREFFAALDATLRGQALVTQALVSRCHYGERRRDVAMDGDIPAALVKPTRYAYQQEVRALWQPRAASIEPIFVNSSAAAKHLRVHQ
jgi:hypothetical protein